VIVVNQKPIKLHLSHKKKSENGEVLQVLQVSTTYVHVGMRLKTLLRSDIRRDVMEKREVLSEGVGLIKIDWRI
jgi:hypothetical protein